MKGLADPLDDELALLGWGIDLWQELAGFVSNWPHCHRRD